MTTPVIFRVFAGKDAIPYEVIALFPALVGDRSVLTCASYQHVGQHGSASIRLFYEGTRPATMAEYMPLMKELERQGYGDLHVYQRYQPRFTAERIKAIG